MRGHWFLLDYNANALNLNSGERDATDIVTDGTYLWVVEDSSTDKDFKYTLSGSLVGNWTISTSGAMSPTGITLDLANNIDLWIVDSGTDRVYQYTGAATRTSGSQSAASFPLAPGNTNPQGIADPPTGGTSEFAAASFPSKGVPATELSALARSAAAPIATAQPPQKPVVTRSAPVMAPVGATHHPLQTVDAALAELFEQDRPLARPAAHKTLSIELVVDDLTAAMR